MSLECFVERQGRVDYAFCSRRVCLVFPRFRVDVRNLFTFQERVQLGLKDISCSAALRMYMGDRSIANNSVTVIVSLLARFESNYQEGSGSVKWQNREYPRG